MTNFGNFGPILIKICGEVYFILTNSILLSNTGTGKILSVRNSVVDPYTVQIFPDFYRGFYTLSTFLHSRGFVPTTPSPTVEVVVCKPPGITKATTQ